MNFLKITAMYLSLQDPNNVFRPASFPAVQCPYQAVNSCTGFQPDSCCERLSGATHSAALHSFYIILAMTFAIVLTALQ